MNDTVFRSNGTDDRSGVHIVVYVPAAAADEHSNPRINGLVQNILLQFDAVLMDAGILILLKNWVSMDEASDLLKIGKACART